MNTKRKRTAEGLLIFRYILSGLFPVITVLAYTNQLSPLHTLAWSSLIAAFFFALVMTLRNEWRENLRNIKALKDISLVVLFIAIGYHGLFFLALEFTSPQNVSLLSLSEVMFSFIIIGLIARREPISRQHAFGAALMALAAVLVLMQGTSAFNTGDLLMIGATILAPIGNMFAKRALHQVSLMYLLFMRSILGAVVFFAVARVFEGPLAMSVITSSLPYLLFSGVVFLGLMKVVTMFGFRETSVIHTISLGALKPVFAFIFAWWLLRDAPTTMQIIALIPSFVGLYLLAKAKHKALRYKV